MKTTTQYFSALGLALTLAASGATAAELDPAKAETVSTDAAKSKAVKPGKEAAKAERKAARKEARKAAAAVVAEAKPAEAAAVVPAPAAPPEEATLRLNFRGAPLDLVLNYLSEAAGYTIVLETSVRGTVDVWSNQPLTRAEAVSLLNSVLNKNGYAALQNGRTLTILSKDDAKKRDIPVVTGSNPSDIPKDDQIVTQIIPVRTISASSLIRDLSGLIPSSSTVTANEGGNALVMTDTRMNIRRVAEIVAALDGAVSASATMKVFALKYADAKALAVTIKDLFQDAGTGGAAAGGRGGRGGGGFPGFGGFGGGGGDTAGSAAASSRNSTTAAKVAAVADEHSNSLIVSASDTQMITIEQLIAKVDTDVQDLTELRVFHLKNADPTETADLLTSLFPDTTTSNNQNGGGRGGGFQFGGGGGIFGGGAAGGGRNGGTTATSDRSKKMGKVIAVPDARTGSVVVSAAKELMPQISEMVLQLDTSNAKKQKVAIYNLDNANVQEVEAVLRSLFESQNSRGTANSSQQNALQNRANQAGQTTTGNTTGFGTGGTGGGRGN